MTGTLTQNPHSLDHSPVLSQGKALALMHMHMYVKENLEHTKNQPDFYYVMENIMNIAKIRNTSHQYTRVCSLQIINVLFQSKSQKLP